MLRFISREEFMGDPLPSPKFEEPNEAKADRAFDVYDKNHDGFITKAEMLKMSKNLTKAQARCYDFSF